jgi:hypothetical protein
MKKILLIGVVVILLCLSSIARAEDTYWIGTTGDWSSPSNWMFKVPESGDVAYVNNGGTANITGGTAEATRVFLGLYGSASIIEHTGGSATFSSDLYIVNGSDYNLSGSGSLTTGGGSGLRMRVGNFNQSGGVHNATSTIDMEDPQSSYSLSGTGQLNSGTVNIRSSFDLTNTATFTQTDGTHNNNHLKIAYTSYNTQGSYKLYGGTLNSTTQTIGGDRGSIGSLDHTAGSNTTNSMILGSRDDSSGTYNLSGTGKLFTTNNLIVGLAGNGIMDQSGGTHEVGGSITLGHDTGSSGFYNISGGALSVSDMRVGYFGRGDFQIANSLADISITNSLLFGPDSSFNAVSGSSITMNGASLDIWSIDQNYFLDFNNLTLQTRNIQLVNNRTNMGGTEALYVRNLILDAGSIIYLNGINLYYENLIDNGGQIIQGTGGVGISTFEVAGQDIGNEGGGYNGNFALDTLHVVPAVPDITVTDSISPNDDLQIPFADLTVHNSSTEMITINNDGNANLDLGSIAQNNPLTAPFSVINDNCSGQSIAPSEQCTFMVIFEPTSTGNFNDSLDIPSNDPDENPVTVNVSGNGLSDDTNNPPHVPILVRPEDGQIISGTKVEFKWKKTGDPDGDPVTFLLYYSEDVIPVQVLNFYCWAL